MLKMYVFLSSEDGHDPFAAAGAAAADRVRQTVAGVVGYTQTRTLDDQIDPQAAPPVYSGVAEFWFADNGAALAAAEHAAALRPLWRDGTVASAVVVGQERVVMRRPEHHRGGFIKGVLPFRRRANMTVADFQHYWWHAHGPIAALTEGAVFYVQCHPLPQCYRNGSPPFDGVTELHWPTVAAARAAMGSRQMREVQAVDAANFAEPDSVLVILAEEEHVVPA